MDKQILNSMKNLPKIEGPISVTDTSHPFGSAAYTREPIDLEAFGYIEEEYFLEGTANIYEGMNEALIKNNDIPYKNRILVRKPKTENFSGRVIVDIYNASNGYDIEDVWRRSYQYILENGHIYIGITSKPINVLSLKNFDYVRYHTLNWSGVEQVSQPTTVNLEMSIPGTEEGLVWDMISHVGNLLRSDNTSFLQGYEIENIYLTGQSQSGMYLNTYVNYFDQYNHELNIFDGYLNVVGAGVMRSLNQTEGNLAQFSAKDQVIPEKLKTPFILLSSQGDINLFNSFGNREEIIKELDGELLLRHYELTSSPHTDPASPLIQLNSEIVKTKNPPKLLDGEYSYTVNDIQLAYYVNTMLEKLHNWVTKGIVAPDNLMIERDQSNTPKKDRFGNGIGGLRSPYIDVPIATYYPNAIANPDEVNQAVGNVNGSMEFFDKDVLYELYADKNKYISKFKDCVQQNLKDGWLLENDAKRMVQWAVDIAERIF
ncbi:alpha/beta hydrolase domain-containing protein [Aerococcaceae bacterium 50-4]